MRIQDSKQFENWITNASALTDKEIEATRRVMHTVHAVRLSLEEQGIRAHGRVDHIVALTKMALEQTCKDT